MHRSPRRAITSSARPRVGELATRTARGEQVLRRAAECAERLAGHGRLGRRVVDPERSPSASTMAPAPSWSSTANRSGASGPRLVSSPAAITAMLVRSPRRICSASDRPRDRRRIAQAPSSTTAPVPLAASATAAPLIETACAASSSAYVSPASTAPITSVAEAQDVDDDHHVGRRQPREPPAPHSSRTW